ncbi:DUF1146 family protein [Floccifex sp.]|uniref:DUF1146 family protein n=1 Tax=Floccifex sp. TaxID=2815810 RepID=UPI0029FECCE0|nr:DUF1146 family protein [Floccifex sp.]MDD7282195.1 DUF1146 family protein [Erysipelotrichaceae bacterium]MDY2958424.1 DUF1146 family protein [Floccifex sp.]
MIYSLVKYIVFVLCFIVSVYACSSIQFEKICKVQKSGKVITLMFLLSFVLAYLSTQAILDLTIFNGFGG